MELGVFYARGKGLARHHAAVLDPARCKAFSFFVDVYSLVSKGGFL